MYNTDNSDVIDSNNVSSKIIIAAAAITTVITVAIMTIMPSPQE